MQIATTVLVVGAGPAGLLTAAELRRRGVDCLLIDAHERPLEWDRATVVHPRSLELFDSLGIVEPLLAAGVRQCGARIHANGEILGEIDLDLCGSRYPYYIGISEETTEAILADYLAAQGGAVQRATKLVGLEDTEDGMLATLEQPDGRATVLAQWVVGCDGHHSTVRELAGIAQEGHDIDYADSPIVMGDRHDAVSPGQRLPDQISFRLAAGGTGMLHDYARRPGHTVFLVGGPATPEQALRQARLGMEALSDGAIIEAVIALTANADAGDVDGYLDPAMAGRLGVGDMVVLAVRADGHVGLRAESRHVESLAAYVDRLRTSGA